MTWREGRQPPTTRPHRPVRYSWCKIPNEFPDYPALRAAALVAKVPVHQVVAVALRLECLANASTPRGSVADFSAIEFAAALQLRPDVVGRIRAALEDPEVFWIDQDIVTGFQARNPESHDPTAADRQRRRRAKLKAEEEAMAQSGPDPPLIHSHVTSRRDVTVSRSREEKNKYPLCREDARARAPVDNCADKPSGEAARLSKGQRPEPAEQKLDDQESAELWLAGEGVRIVSERLRMERKDAAGRIAYWRDRELGGDAVALQRIISGAGQAGSSGLRFSNLIVGGIRDAKRQATKQGELRLPVPLVSERKLG